MKIVDGNKKLFEKLEIKVDNIRNGKDEKLRIAHFSHLDLDGYSSIALSNLLMMLEGTGKISLSYYNIIPQVLNNELETFIIENIDNYDLVIVTDLAITEDTVNIIKACNSSYKIILLDHHMNDVIDVPDNIRVTKNSPFTLGRETCATELYLKFIYESPLHKFIDNIKVLSKMSLFVELVRIYDTYEFWKHRKLYPDGNIYHTVAPKLNTLFHIMERHEFIQYIFDFINDNTIDAEPKYIISNSRMYPWIEKVLSIEVKRNEKYIKSAVNRMVKTKFSFQSFKKGNIYDVELSAGIVFAERSNPSIANTILANNEDIDIAIVVSNNQVTMYSDREDVDVYRIAKVLGGGGHSDAAGFVIPYHIAATYNVNHFNSIVGCAASIAEGIIK